MEQPNKQAMNEDDSLKIKIYGTTQQKKGTAISCIQ